MKPRTLDRRGVTLVELLVAILIAGLVLSTALTFLQGQDQAFSFGTGRLTVLQNHRFALNQLEQNLRVMGSGTAAQQPWLVYAGADVVAFNANYTASGGPDTVTAVYIDTTAAPEAVRALREGDRFVLPGTSFAYPDTSYTDQGTNSYAETIVFFFLPDSSTTRVDDDYVLYRQVNRQAPEVVARNLRRTGDTPFFTYLKRTTDETGALRLTEIPPAGLPLQHSTALHGTEPDLGAEVDEVRAVRINLTASNGRPRGDRREQSSAAALMVWLPNAGVQRLQICGDAPLAPASLSVRRVPIGAGSENALEVSWPASADDGGGENDAMLYVLWRRSSSSDPWGDPYVSLPAGSFVFQDRDVDAGTPYSYALGVQDCTPKLSALLQSPFLTP